MRFDDLLLSEDDYASSLSSTSGGSGTGGSVGKWVLMYSRGVPPAVIARWCRVGVWQVSRAIRRQAARDPGWFGRCLVVHDQPSLPSPSRRGRVGREQSWWNRYTDLASHLHEHGRFPSQTGGGQARALYGWLQSQRAHHQAGTLSEHKVEALDLLGQWKGVPRGRPDTHWQTRLHEAQAFRADYGRDPVYDPVRRPEEKVLAIWLGYQRTLARRHQLRSDRRDRLDEVLPGWNASIAA